MSEPRPYRNSRAAELFRGRYLNTPSVPRGDYPGGTAARCCAKCLDDEAKVACCHGVKDHHGDGPWIKVTCCPGVKDHQDDGSWIIVRMVPYHGSEDTMGGEGWWRPTMGPAELDAMVG